MIDAEKLKQLLENVRGERPRCMKCKSTEAVGVNQIFGFVVPLCLFHRIEWDWVEEHEADAQEMMRADMQWQAIVAKAYRVDVPEQVIEDLIARKIACERKMRLALAHFLGIAE